MSYTSIQQGSKGIPNNYKAEKMNELEEMNNPIAEVAEGLEVLVKGKKVKGSRCNNGELHTGYQLAGLHPCECPKPKAKAKKKTTVKKKAGK
jgi:hypothetical protein